MSNIISTTFSADVKDLKKGVSDAVTTIVEGGKTMATASEASTQKVVSGQKSLQQAYRATYKDAQILAIQQGTNSQAFQEAARKAAEYKDRLEDVQDAMKAASGEQRWKLVASGMSGAIDVANGLVGVMSLLGVETNSAQKAIQVMMSLQAISGAIQGVIALSEAYTALAIVVSSTVVPALAAVTLETALMTGGISVLIGGLTYLGYKGVKYYGELKAAAKQAGQEMSNQNEIWRRKFGGETVLPFSLKQGDGYFSPEVTVKIKPKIDAKTRDAFSTELISGFKGIADYVGTMPQLIGKIQAPIIELKGHVNELGVFFDELGAKVGGWGNIMSSALGNVGYAMGSAITGATDMGKEFLSIIGGIAGELGSALIQMGMKIALIAPLKGGLMIAAGVGLKIMSGAMGGASQGGSTASSFGGANQANQSGSFMPGFQGTSSMINVNGMVRGNDLAIVTINTANSNKRIRR